MPVRIILLEEKGEIGSPTFIVNISYTFIGNCYKSRPGMMT